MSYGWVNCFRTELRTTFLLQINCKSYDIKVIIIRLNSNNKLLFKLSKKHVKVNIGHLKHGNFAPQGAKFVYQALSFVPVKANFQILR